MNWPYYSGVLDAEDFEIDSGRCSFLTTLFIDITAAPGEWQKMCIFVGWKDVSCALFVDPQSSFWCSPALAP